MNAPDAESLRAEIAATRSQLGETLEALAAKTDVRSRVREAAVRRTAPVKDRTSMVLGDVKDRTSMVIGDARSRSSIMISDVRSRSGAMMSDAKATLRDTRRSATQRVESLPGGPAPWAFGGAALAGVSVVAWLAWRRRG